MQRLTVFLLLTRSLKTGCMKEQPLASASRGPGPACADKLVGVAVTWRPLLAVTYFTGNLAA